MKKYLAEIVIVLFGLFAAFGILFLNLIEHKTPIQNTVVQYDFEDIRPLNVESEIIRGNPEAKIFIVEYGDLQCPYCRATHPILKEYIRTPRGVQGDVAWIFRSTPYIDQISDQKAETLACVHLLYTNDIIWKFLDESLIVTQEKAYPYDRYNTIFKKIGVDTQKIEKCREEGTANTLFQQAKRDSEVLEIDVTPVIHFVTDEGAIVHQVKGYQSKIDIHIIVLSF